ncbi:hypothetical protein [Streptomyces arenae]|uniref:hypothetical protein n=1 Tax=Streptomyces arenae TaxID=29301 RepID=UPI002659AD21|nr:hypothetical protein [Streptomyces arenae]MCG7203325.1 hypothetical protein [Streptomyces arenae]
MGKRSERNDKDRTAPTLTDEVLEQVGKRAGRADADRGAPERAASGDPITPSPGANEKTLRGRRSAPRN